MRGQEAGQHPPPLIPEVINPETDPHTPPDTPPGGGSSSNAPLRERSPRPLTQHLGVGEEVGLGEAAGLGAGQQVAAQVGDDVVGAVAGEGERLHLAAPPLQNAPRRRPLAGGVMDGSSRPISGGDGR